jgi:hypothetical protein
MFATAYRPLLGYFATAGQVGKISILQVFTAKKPINANGRNGSFESQSF